MFWSGVSNTHAVTLLCSIKFHVPLENKVLSLWDLTTFWLSISVNTEKVQDTQHSLLDAVGKAIKPPGHQVKLQGRGFSMFLHPRLSCVRLQYSWFGRAQGRLGQGHTLSRMRMCICMGVKDLPSCLWHWKLLFNLLKWISGVFLPHFSLGFPRREKNKSTCGG